MNNYMTEAEALTMLGIPSFQMMTKEKMGKFASVYSQMHPEVAKKCIEQFPEFANTTREYLDQYKEVVVTSMQSNDQSMNAYYANTKNMIDALIPLLQNDNLSFEDKKYVIEEIDKIQERMGAKDTENKKFHINMSVIVSTAVVGLGTALISALLGKNQKTLSSKKPDNSTRKTWNS